VKPQHTQPTTAEDPTGYHSSPLQIGKRSCNLQELTKIRQLKTGKMLPGLMSLDFSRVRIWVKQNENMDPACLVTTVQAGGDGVMVWGMFSWNTLGPFSANWASFKFFYLKNTSSRIMHNVTKLESFLNWFLEHDNEFTVLKWPPQWPDLNPIEHLWDVVERELCALDLIDPW